MYRAVWLLHDWCHMKLLLSQRILCTPYNHAPCQSHICRVLQHVCLAVTCHLHFWQNDQDLSCYCNTMGDTEIRVSTESWPWRRKFSYRSCLNLNLWPFDHESIALLLSSPCSPFMNKITLSMPLVTLVIWFKGNNFISLQVWQKLQHWLFLFFISVLKILGEI